MLLGVRPIVFLARLLLIFAVTYFLRERIAPAYTQLLAFLTHVTMRLTELGVRTPAARRRCSRAARAFSTCIGCSGRGRPAFPPLVQANMVLLIAHVSDAGQPAGGGAFGSYSLRYSPGP
jgi:hypothetical protein